MTGAPAALDSGVELSLHRDAPADALELPLDLFRDARFYALHRDAFERAWYAVARDTATGRCLAAGWLAEIEPGHARSPGRGTYGQLQTVGPRLSLTRREEIVRALELALRAEGIDRLTIVLPPAVYDADDHAESVHVLARAGFTTCAVDLDYAVEVRAEPLDARMNSGNRYVARTAERHGLAFRVLTSGERAEAYAVNAENRAKRGYPLTMTLDALLAMEDRFPARVLWFGVFHESRMIAASVSLVIDPERIYVFYWGEVRGAEKLSPVTVLAQGIYRECQRRGARLLDVGISTVHGAPNHGLIAYKRNLGCTASLKLTFTKDLV